MGEQQQAQKYQQQQQQQQQQQEMAFDALSRSVVTERTGDNSGEQCLEESTTTGYGGFFAPCPRADKADASVANSCSNSSSQSSSRLHEHDYIGLAGDSSSVSVDQTDESRGCMSDVPDLNLGLRLGPPKDKDTTPEVVALVVDNKEKGNNSAGMRFKLPSAGSKRGYSETVEDGDLVVKGMSSKLLFPWSNSNSISNNNNTLNNNNNNNNVNNSSSKSLRPIDQQRNSFVPFQRKDTRLETVNFSCLNASEETPTSSGPMVGWPPVQSFRKNTLVAPSSQTAATKSSADREALALSEQLNAQGSSLFVKVYMDGVPIGRKVDLDTNNSYPKLASALREMFSGFVNGQSVSKQKPNLSAGEVHNLFDGYETEYVLTYEDKDGDLMLVGDVPWRMFAATVKRLRIMKGSDAIGLGAPKEFEDPSRAKAAS